MNNLPKTLIQFDGKEETILSLPLCDSCEELSTKDNPVKEHGESMICWSCATDDLWNKYFPKPQSEMSKIHEDLIPF